MQKLIYVAILLFALFFSASLLIVYYTQEFNENIALKDTLSGIDFFGEESSSNNLCANLGLLSLENKGIFSKTYFTGKLQGCINFKDTNSASLSIFLVEPLLWRERVNANQCDFSLDYPRNIELPSHTNRSFVIGARYYSYDYPSLSVLEEKVSNISIYSDDSNSFSCYRQSEYAPIKVILLR